MHFKPTSWKPLESYNYNKEEINQVMRIIYSLIFEVCYSFCLSAFFSFGVDWLNVLSYAQIVRFGWLDLIVMIHHKLSKVKLVS